MYAMSALILRTKIPPGAMIFSESKSLIGVCTWTLACVEEILPGQAKKQVDGFDTCTMFLLLFIVVIQ